MNKLTLNILASDIKETIFTNSTNCAITRALNRAGKEWSHIGFNQVRTEDDLILEVEGMQQLSSKVWDMYNNYTTPEDFTFTLQY